MSDWKKSVCPLDCPDSCGLLVKVENGCAVKVKGDPEHPFTQGFLCRKMSLYHQRVHSPDRLTTPMLRSGPKGSGQFREISWEEAFETLKEKITSISAEHGPQAILPYCYAGHMGVVQRHIGHAFFHRLGASKLGWTICSSTGGAGFASSLGRVPSQDIESAADSDLIIIWGANTLTTNLHAWPFFQQAKKNGARLVVIDPYRNQTAARADQHLMLKPGTDAALALAMMNVLIAEDLIDRDYIAQHSVGFDELAGRAAEYTPQRAAEISGVPAEDIASLAREYGRAKAPYIRLGQGAGRQLRGAMAIRTIALLPALIGALGRHGGITYSNAAGAPVNMAPLTREDLMPPGTRTVNMVQLGDALTRLEDPPLKMLYVYLSNPAVVAPDLSLVRQGLMREDLFTVVHDLFLTGTAMHADLVLPATTSLEMGDLYKSYGQYYMQMAGPVVKPVGDSRSMLQVFQELATRLGYTEEVFSASLEEIVSWLLETDAPYLEGITLERLKTGKTLRLKVPANPFKLGFKTPSGKVEFFSQALADAGHDPLPDGTPSLDAQGQGTYPLQLITPPKKQFLNSSFNEVPELVAEAGPADILLHTGDADARGVSNGQEVRVFNGRGSCVLQARVSDGVSPGVVVAEGLYWGRHMNGAPINSLTSQNLADWGGSNAFHCSLVEVEPA